MAVSWIAGTHQLNAIIVPRCLEKLCPMHVKDRSDIRYPRVKLQRDFLATLSPRLLIAV
jgi:hypothetical protein